MKNLFVVSLFIVSCFIIGCSSGGSTMTNHNGYTITGTVENAKEGTQVFLDDLDGQKLNVIDTAEIDAQGKFEMLGKVDKKSIGRLRVGVGRSNVMLIIDNATMNFTYDLKNPNAYQVEGPDETVQMQGFISKVLSFGRDLKGVQDYARTFAAENASPLLSYMAINYLKPENSTEDYEVFKSVAQRLEKELPNAGITQQMRARMGELANGRKTAVGSAAPNLVGDTPEGGNLSLEKLKGKVVLIDFWASWCKPCRRENPTVVAAYKKYKNKGFEVFSVSLDKQKERWVQAIKADNLIWDSHISDLGGWQSRLSADYGVRSIPQTFLLDQDGVIIAKNLRGAALEAKLKELLGA